MAYELWDAETANLIGAYDTEDEALDVVAEMLRDHGTPYVETLTLAYEDRQGRSRTIALGSALVDRARPGTGARSPVLTPIQPARAD